MDELGLVARREEEWVTRNGRVLGEARPAAAVHCPVPAQRARDRCIHPGTKTCPPIPDLLCLRDISGVPFEYVNGTGTNRATRLTVVSRRTVPVVQRFTPPIRDALTSFLANMTRFGMPVEALLTLGSLYCRCVTGSDTLSNHSFGDAIDIAGVRWPAAGGPASRARETIVHNWANPDQRALLRRIDACLRLSFNTVIDYHRTDHRDHFHCDSNSRAGSVRAMGRSTTTPHFAQEALSHVLGRPVPETGQWDRATMNALQQFSGVDAQGLKDRRRLNEVLDQLFTRVASGASAAPAGPMGLDWFRFDSSTLTPYHSRLIDRIASRVAASWQGAKPIREIRLIGHTDSRGSTSYNETLGLRRAQAVKNALSRAIEARQPGTASRLRYTTHSHGAARPVSPRTTEAARARNRRVEVTLAATPSPALEPAAAEHEAPPAVPALAAAAPALLYTESSVPTETHYVTIPLGQEAPAPPMTGIFVPAGYRRSSQVDLILYLQGHHKGGGFPADLAIDS